MTDPIDQQDPKHLIRLGQTDWWLWRDTVLRGAGFPAVRVRELADPELAAASDRAIETGRPEDAAAFRAVYEQATQRLSAAIRDIAAEPRFREAIAWQNHKLLAECVDKAAAGEPRNVRGRNHELTIASYWQRYCTKNDTIGFFGPVGWAHWSEQPTSPLSVDPGAELVARRTTYFEVWAIDALAETLAEAPKMLPWLAPRLTPDCKLEGTVLYRPNRSPVLLTDAEAELLSLCDGERTGHEIADELAWSGLSDLESEPEVLALLASLRDRKLILLDLEGPVCARPENELRSKLVRIGEPALREEMLGRLDALTTARSEVSDAAGDVAQLVPALQRANDTFTRVTGKAPVRRPGVTYGGRTIMYEDTVRDVRVDLGGSLLDELATPLGLLLDSARWAVGEAAKQYDDVFDSAYERVRQRTGEDAVPLSAVVGLATPSLFFSLRELPEPVRKVKDELQRRWEPILRVPEEVRHHEVRSIDIADAVREAFPSPAPAWSEALHHSPDVMIAASSAEAVAAGDYSLILGEMHLASNTVESRLFVEQHPDPAQLRAADAADHGSRRIYLVPPKHWQSVNSRTYPPSALLSPDYTFWSLHADAGGAPGAPLPVADLLVRREQGELIVCSRDRTHRFSLLEMVGELLSAAVVNGFRPLASSAHRPRISIDRLVVGRESWTLPVTEASWAKVKDESRRFQAARTWRSSLGIPERAFYKLPCEDKPSYVDFSSLVLVNLFAKGLRRAEGEDVNAEFSLSEMLPDTDQTWLTDAAGAGYTAELRLVAVDRSAESLCGSRE